ncbi:MAG: DUF2628 domain-containing protein [Bhargavaea sp.]
MEATVSDTGTTAREEELLGIYVGPEKAGVYEQKWKKERFSWNWAAFIFGLFWLGYRKMYIPLLVILGLFLLFDVVAYMMGDFEAGWDYGIGLVVSIVLGVGGNQLYRQDAERKIRKIQTHYRPEHVEMAVMKKGGAGFISFLLGFLLFLAYGLVTGAIAVFMEFMYL